MKISHSAMPRNRSSRNSRATATAGGSAFPASSGRTTFDSGAEAIRVVIGSNGSGNARQTSRQDRAVLQAAANRCGELHPDLRFTGQKEGKPWMHSPI